MSTLLIVILAVVVLGALAVAYRKHYRRTQEHHDDTLTFIRHLAEEMEAERDARDTGRHHLRPAEVTTEIPVIPGEGAEFYQWPTEETHTGTFNGTVVWAPEPEALVVLHEQADRLTAPEDR